MIVVGTVTTVGVLAGVPAVAAPGPERSKARVTVVATGLNNPRGVIVGPDGVLLVAEAGFGAGDKFGQGPCVPSPEDPAVLTCVGLTGSVTVVVPPHARPFGLTHSGTSKRWRDFRIVRGLPSVAGEDGSSALGPHDLAFSRHELLATIGLGGSPETREALGPKGRLLGRVVKLRPFDGARSLADLAAYEAANNPDQGDVGSEIDSNPYGLLGNWHGRTVATDAGGNSVLAIDRKGRITTLAVLHVSMVPAPPFLGLPPGTLIPMQAVPTSVVRGPDNALYIGQLTGFPFPPGGATVWRLAPNGTLSPYAEGFTNIVDIAFDRQGRLLVLSIAKDGLLNTPPGQLPVGSLIRVERNGSRTEIAAGRLLAPGGVAVGEDGCLYVTNKSILRGAGELLRIRP
jgi:hypothetical protein